MNGNKFNAEALADKITGFLKDEGTGPRDSIQVCGPISSSFIDGDDDYDVQVNGGKITVTRNGVVKTEISETDNVVWRTDWETTEQ